MEATRILGFGILAAVTALVVRLHRPELALQIGIAAGVFLFLMVADRLGGIVRVLETLAGRAQLDPIYLGTVLKVIATAYLVGFGAQVCRDAGERAIAEKVELAGKVLILALAMPVMLAVLDTVTRLLP